jgi:penicillin-binding protein 2
MDTRFIFRTIVLGFLGLAATLFSFQVKEGAAYLDKARNNYLKIVPVPALRGNVFDRNRVELATDKPVFNIAITPYQIRKEKDQLFDDLVSFLGQDKKNLETLYRKNFRNVFSPVDILVNISKETALKVKEKFKDKVSVRVLPQRDYNFSQEFAHVLGYVKESKVVPQGVKEYGYSPYQRGGVGGIEQYYDSYLKGEDGSDLIEVNSKGEMVGFLGKKNRVRGRDLHLTLDADMQKVAYESLLGWQGSLVLMDPNSGEIYALVSRPSFSSNDLMTGKNTSQILNNKSRPLINRAIQSRYPPGSIFKVIMAMGGLEEGVINSKTSVNCIGHFNLGQARFGCNGVHGWESVTEALMHSCNVYFYELGLKLKVEKIAKWARKFGLNKKTFVDLPYDKAGLVPDRSWKRKVKRQNWYGGDSMNFSIGQGFLEITPLKAAAFISVFANGGYNVYPYVADSVDDNSIPHRAKEPLGLSVNNLGLVRQGLRQTVAHREGTAYLLKSLKLGMAGKTGTSQTSRKSHGWFVGFFPYHNPKYTICVFLEHGDSSHNALEVARIFLSKLQELGKL